ncbi:hypothetical protein MPSEU_000457300 [Mayamaea pseudoterrestris]|nr:hypothetical protein MPSEU_000457300 [Mayamaea pseudoterrestris]
MKKRRRPVSFSTHLWNEEKPINGKSGLQATASSNGSSDEEKQEESSLVDIHGQFFAKLHQQQQPLESLASIQNFTRLQSLKRQRSALAAELQVLKEQRAAAAAAQSDINRQQSVMDHEQALLQQRPYLTGMVEHQSTFLRLMQRHHHMQAKQRCEQDGHNDDASKQQQQQQQPQHALHQTMNEYRQQTKIQAAYQLLGKTFYCPDLLQQHDSGMLGLCIHVFVAGAYYNCHHVFFELVMTCGGTTKNGTTNAPMLQLQYKQDTLPQHTSYMDILRKHLGSSLALGPWLAPAVNDDHEHHNTALPPDCYAAIHQRLQVCAAELYDLCFAHAVRNEAVRFLKEQPSATDSKYSIEQVATTGGATIDSISFILCLRQSLPHHDNGLPTCIRLSVRLHYDPKNYAERPSDVSVHLVRNPTVSHGSRSAASVASTSSRDVISDDEDNDSDTNISGSHGAASLVNFATTAFQRRLVPHAINAIVAHATVHENGK